MTDDERRRRIVGAALRALDDQDYEHVQMRDVAAAAGVALGTLYRHFSSKEHLYATVLLEWAAAGRSVPPRDGTQGGSSGGSSGESSGEWPVRTRIHGVITAYERQPRFYRAQVVLQGTGDANARAVLREFAAIAKAVLAADLCETPPGLPPERAGEAAAMLWSLVMSRLAEAVYGDGSTDEVHRLADVLITLLAGRPRSER